MSGSNYHVSYLQILEAEHRLKISNRLTLFSNTNTQPSSQISMEEFIQSFSPIYSVHTDTEIDIDPFLDALSDVSAIECDTPTLQSLACIAGYAAYQYLKHSSPSLICRDILIIDKDILVDESFELRYQLLQLSDRGGLKYPSELALESLIIVWKILTIIQSNSEFMSLLIEGQTRKILVTLGLAP